MKDDGFGYICQESQSPLRLPSFQHRSLYQPLIAFDHNCSYPPTLLYSPRSLSFDIFLISLSFLLHTTIIRLYRYRMSGPPPGVGAPSPEQIAAMKEAGVRTTFVADLGMGFGPFILG